MEREGTVSSDTRVSDPSELLNPASQDFTLRPYFDWICLVIACLIGLISHYVSFRIPW
jgi:hypothetical protein